MNLFNINLKGGIASERYTMIGIHILKTMDKNKLTRKQLKAIKQSDKAGVTSKGYSSKFDSVSKKPFILLEDMWAKDLFI